MEKIEPALFENAILGLTNSSHQKVKAFAQEKIQTLSLDKGSDITKLATQAHGSLEDSDLLSINPEKLMKLSKSVKPADRMMSA